MAHPLRRPVALLLALLLALVLLVATPQPARAHDSCAVQQPAATGVLGSVLQAVNIFASFLPTAAAYCPDKFADVEVKIARDFTVDSVDEDQGPRGVQPPSPPPATYARCSGGTAAGVFPCDGVDMLSHVSHEEMGTTFVNDIWGWTDPETGKDHALVGATEGTVFVDISDPLRPAVLGILPAHTLDPQRPFWRDIKVYRDHAFVVSEQRGHGVQVFDLTQLRDWDGSYTYYENTAHYDGHGSAHNIAINEDTGYAYSVGAGQTRRGINCGSGLHMIDIRNPTNPRFAGCFQDHGYVHDTQCVVYEGPDVAFQGREICFNSNGIQYALGGENYVSIVDVTNKRRPVALSRIGYDGSGYSHQGWLTEDQAWFLHGDEGDEILAGVNTTTRVWDVSDLRTPRVHQVFENDTTSIDHNLYTLGSQVFASNYTTGLRVYDASSLVTTGLSELAYFDVYPENDNATFEGGTWSNYPYLAQDDVVAVSSIDRGLFVLQLRQGSGR
jgi:choice-of-anchor B domain-containing protein